MLMQLGKELRQLFQDQASSIMVRTLLCASRAAIFVNCVILRERQRVKDLPEALAPLADPSPRVTRLRMTASCAAQELTRISERKVGCPICQRFRHFPDWLTMKDRVFS
jgi:hypothetical protein